MAYNIFIQVNTMQDKNKQAWITVWLAKEATTAHRPQATLVSIISGVSAAGFSAAGFSAAGFSVLQLNSILGLASI